MPANTVDKVRGIFGNVANATTQTGKALSSSLTSFVKTNNGDGTSKQKRDAVSSLNPFLNREGGLVNKHINYQKLLDDDSVNPQIKTWVEQATGLQRTPVYNFSIDGYTGRVTPSGSGASGSADKSTWKATGNAIVDSAAKYLGTPYVWGGESMAEGGMDCSGFVYNALKDAGYSVGRTTAQGYRSQGDVVNKADMQPGDLVFFGKNGNASHIGIYLGNGQMIHSSGGSRNTASNPGKGVSITNVDYISDFIEARRISR